MTMPRISALSEITWTAKELKDYDDFSKRLNQQFIRYDHMNVNYRIPHPVMPDTLYIAQNNKVTIGNPSNNTEIRYTLDGTDPDHKSKLYSESISIDTNALVKAVCIKPKGRSSSVASSVVIVK
jgi:hexosaminidase